jgi:aminoglycoside phosphotransferase (APT) family kinase protein
LSDVLSVHPQFDLARRTIGCREVPALKDLITWGEDVEAQLAAPFSILLHGDYNSNNILYDPAEDRIHYIDLHRSADADLVQDVSVYMISHFRLPVFDEPRRKMLLAAILDMYAFARTFAIDHGDATFDIRLALGLARSLVTSTRFELSQRFSRLMFQRGVYLLTRIVGHTGEPAAFRLPLEAMRH